MSKMCADKSRRVHRGWIYKEYVAYCRQYDEKRLSTYDTDKNDARMIELAVGIPDDGAWYDAIISNVCRAVPYEHIPAWRMPSSMRAEFFRARRLFFEALWELRHELRICSDEKTDSCNLEPKKQI